MNETTRAYRKRLLALRARLRGDIARLADNALSKARGELTRMPIHMAELGSDAFDQELTLSLLGTGEVALEQVDAAIARIEDGSYGRCETCSQSIPPSRLHAIPYATQCVHCASRREDPLNAIGIRKQRRGRILPR